MATILVVDDDISLLARLGTQLTDAGYNVIKMSEAVPAEIAFIEQRPDLVLLEVKTSRGEGWQLLDHFAAHKPVIVISADGREEDVIRGLEAGAVDYLAKPYRSAELLARIRLRLRETEQQTAPPQEIRPAPPLAVAIPDAIQPPTAENTDVVAASAPGDATVQSEPATTNPMPRTRRNQSVFMDETEELALLRSSNDVPPEPQDMLPGEASLGASLRAERQRRRITLVQAENELHIRMWYLQAMEEEKFSLLPRGPMATDMLRSYAAYLGMNVPWAMAEYERIYTERPVETFAMTFGEEPGWSIPRWLIWVAAIVLALVVSGGGIMMFDPGGVNALGSNLRIMVGAITVTPTRAIATPRPSPTRTSLPTPSATTTRTPTPTPTIAPSPTLTTTATLPEGAPPGSPLTDTLTLTDTVNAGSPPAAAPPPEVAPPANEQPTATEAGTTAGPE